MSKFYEDLLSHGSSRHAQDNHELEGEVIVMHI